MKQNIIELSKSFCNEILTYTKLCKLVDMETAIIDQFGMRSFKDDHSLFIIYKPKSLDFKAMGISKLSALNSRMDLINKNTDFTVIATYNDAETYIKSLTLINQKTKIDFRCCNPATLGTIPKGVKDKIKYKISLNQDDIIYMNKALNAMKFGKEDGKYINLYSKKAHIYYQIVDANNDKFEHEICNKIDILDDDETEVSQFNSKFDADILIPLLKQSDKTDLFITQDGDLKISINNIDIHIIKKV